MRRSVLVSAASALLAVASPSNARPSPATPVWTFAFYCDADNELESAILRQMEALLPFGGSRQVQLVALVDRHDEQGCAPSLDKGYTDRDAANVKSWSGAKYLRIDRCRFEDLTPGKPQAVDMGDPLVLAAFLSYAKRQYPADHFVLVLNDHGGGPSGLCRDREIGPCKESYRSHLSLADLSQAFCMAGLDREPLDVVMLDACDMATIEVLQTLRPFARYAVAAESQISDGFRHDLVVRDVIRRPGAHPSWVASRFARAYEAGVPRRRKSGRMSAFDLSAVDRLGSSIERLADALLEGLEQKGDAAWARFTRERFRCAFLLGGTCFNGFDCQVNDVGELAERLAATGQDEIARAAAGVAGSLRAGILASSYGPDSADLTGLSIYSPCDPDDDWVELPPFLRNSPWTRFVKASRPCRPGPGVDLSPASVDRPKIRPGEAACVEATVTSDMAWLGFAYFTVLDFEGKEIGPRVRVEPDAGGRLAYTWRAGAFYAESPGNWIGLQVPFLRETSRGIFTAEAPVGVDGRSALLQFTLSGDEWAASQVRLSPVGNRWRPKLREDESEHSVTSRLRGLPPAPGNQSSFFEGTGSVRSKEIEVVQRALPNGVFQVGFVGVQLDGAPRPRFTTVTVTK